MTKVINYMNVNELHEEANIGYLLEFYVLVNFIVMKIGTRFHGNSKANYDCKCMYNVNVFTCQNICCNKLKKNIATC